MKNRLLCLFSAAAAVIAAGCVDIDYVGQTLPREDATHTVAIFDSSGLVPKDTYKPMGRVTMVAPESRTMVDLREMLEQEAMERGADAVEMVKVKKRKVGMVYHTDSDNVKEIASDKPNNYTADGLVYTDSFGKNTTLRKERVERYEIVIEAVLLAKKERLEHFLQENTPKELK